LASEDQLGEVVEVESEPQLNAEKSAQKHENDATDQIEHAQGGTVLFDGHGIPVVLHVGFAFLVGVGVLQALEELSSLPVVVLL
jgi:hypothetical protein